MKTTVIVGPIPIRASYWATGEATRGFLCHAIHSPLALFHANCGSVPPPSAHLFMPRWPALMTYGNTLVPESGVMGGVHDHKDTGTG